jgi:hypothetical protein
MLIDEQGRRHLGLIDQVTQEWTAVRLTEPLKHLNSRMPGHHRYSGTSQGRKDRTGTAEGD